MEYCLAITQEWTTDTGYDRINLKNIIPNKKDYIIYDNIYVK